MKLISHISILLTAAILFLTSCERDNFDETILDDPIYTPPIETYNDLVSLLIVQDVNYIELGCLKLGMPINFIQASGDTLYVNNKMAAEAALQLVDEAAVVDFAFPLLAENQFTRFIVMKNNKSLADYYVNCVPSTGWTTAESNEGAEMPAFLMQEYNLKVSYPVTLTNGIETIVAEDQEEFINYKITNPNLAFVFPFQLSTTESGELMVSDMESFFNTIYENSIVVPPYVDGNIPVNGFDCNEMQFPIEVKIEDGELINLADQNQYALRILTEEWTEIQYPFDLSNQSTGQTTVYQLSDLLTMQDQCGYTNEPVYTCTYLPHLLLFFNITPNECYFQINYPIQILVEGSAREITTGSDYTTIRNNLDNDDAIELVYPITVTVDTETRTYYSAADVCMYSKECEQ